MVTDTLAAPLEIYRALVAVSGELAKIGISKDRRNEQQNFRFRGIDDVMNAVGPLFAKHDIVLTVHYTDYPDIERVTGKGTTLIYSKVRGEFTFISAKDGSSLTATTFGVAMDSGDKGTNKAMSAALKYALLQIILIPTEASEDADATTPEPSLPKPPDGLKEWWPLLLAVADEGFDPLRQAWKDSPEVYRDYVMAYLKPEWDAAKLHATAVTKARKVAPPVAEDAGDPPAAEPSPRRRAAR